MNNGRLETKIKKILQNSANPYIRGEIKSDLVREHWEKFCRMCKFPDLNGRYVKLKGLFDLLFQENQSPRFLMHNFTTDINSIRLLQEGKTLDYKLKPENGHEARGENAFSLHGCGGGLWYTWGIFRGLAGVGKETTVPGFAIFNNQFHEKICSRRNISKEELLEAQDIIKQANWKNYFSAENLTSLQKIIRSIDGKALKDYCADVKIPRIYNGIHGMITLREGNFYELDVDVGLRAVEITRERDFRLLPITPKDVKYLIEFDNSQHQIDYKILNVGGEK